MRLNNKLTANGNAPNLGELISPPGRKSSRGNKAERYKGTISAYCKYRNNCRACSKLDCPCDCHKRIHKDVR